MVTLAVHASNAGAIDLWRITLSGCLSPQSGTFTWIQERPNREFVRVLQRPILVGSGMLTRLPKPGRP